MKGFLVALFAGLTLTLASLAAQPPRALRGADAQSRGPEPIALTGCLVQGTTPTVFLLENAKFSATDRAEKGRTYLLLSGTEDLNFKAHVSHLVTVTGSAEPSKAPEPPAEQKLAEKDLPKLTAKSLTMVSDRCTG